MKYRTTRLIIREAIEEHGPDALLRWVAEELRDISTEANKAHLHYYKRVAAMVETAACETIGQGVEL